MGYLLEWTLLSVRWDAPIPVKVAGHSDKSEEIEFNQAWENICKETRAENSNVLSSLE